MIDSEKFSLDNIAVTLKEEQDAIIYIDEETDCYHVVSAKGIYGEMISATGNYHDLIEKLWFHFDNSSDAISKDYHVFIPTFGKFQGKYSKRLKLLYQDTPHIVQMTIYPLERPNQYLMLLVELDNSEYIQEFFTKEKERNIQNTYLFSMYVDLMKDTTSSISITEISDEPFNATELSYTNWRMMIVNMIAKDDQTLFLEQTAPEFLHKHLVPGRTTSFDCMMQNLEGKYIWVKLIFRRVDTDLENDFRFVFMVQDIHDSSMKLLSTLKKYAELALKDPLTGVFNRGSIDTELTKAIEQRKQMKQPLAVMMIDIDHFKDVNDTYGHSVGDSTLKRFVKIINGCIQAKGFKLGRWGGEEFLVICENTSLENVLTDAEAMRKNIEEEAFETVGRVTCSIGVVELREDDTAASAFARVDNAMYQAKTNGRNCVCTA